jgi:CheY-like chemotaxis protein
VHADEHMAPSKRVVVINDTKEILELFHEILKEQGHEVVLLSYAPDDLQRIIEAAPDLIIVDFVLGTGREHQGWQLLQKIRMHSSTEHIPIIACTAALQQVREQEGYLLEQGIGIVLKPFTIEQLENAVEKALETRGSTGNAPASEASKIAGDKEPTARR